jgi:cell division protein FtsI (penicillin-binding protein 3)
VRPKLVLKRGDKPEPDQPTERILQPETVMKMRLMMEGVVLRGTARGAARLDGYTSAGKTGTAQIFDAVNHRYTHMYNASFMGFTPVVNPRLVIVVTLNGTEGNAGMGASAAAPVFKVIATEALRLMDVPPDIPEDVIETERKRHKNLKPLPETVAIADLDGGSILEEDADLRKQLLEQKKLAAARAAEPEIPAAPLPAPVPPAAVRIASQSAPASVGSVPAGSRDRQGAVPGAAVVPVATTGSQVPDFRGKSLREVVEEASAEGIELTLEGSGVARAQLPPPGTPLHSGERIRVVLTR